MAGKLPFPESGEGDGEAGAASSGARPHILLSAIAAIGILGLVLATITDSIAVAGRHLGLPLIGSIEVVQTAIVLLACAAMLLATASRTHASIHILTERVGPRARRSLAVLASVTSVCVALALAAGSLMILGDTWAGHERSETLHIPYALLRTLVVASLFGVALLFARDLWRAHDDA